MLNQVAQFIFDTGTKLFNSILTSWGIIGLFIIGRIVLDYVVNLIKRFFR